MKKKTKTTAAKDRKPAKTEAPFVDLLNAAMNEMKDRFLINKGKHDARASLLAPTLAGLKRAADARVDGHAHAVSVTLNATTCALLLDCLAEAGYVPAPASDAPKGAEQPMRIVRMPIPAPRPLDGYTDKANPGQHSSSVSKAA